MIKSTLLTIVLICGLSVSAFGLGRESGGGEVYGDALNPWFLENTKDVSYCIEVDSVNFGAPQVSLDSLVESAIKQWKSAFAMARANETANPELQPYGMVRIATQNFRKEICQPSTMVRFQFGVLTKEQRQRFLPAPEQVIAEAVRTSYDQVHLSGRGFIYIAPDSGPARPKGLKMAKHPWSFQNGLVLKRVLLHEIGHLFGLSHSGNAFSLMGQAHPEYLAQNSTIQSLSEQPAKAVEEEFKRIGVFGFEFPFTHENCVSDGVILLGGQEQSQFFGFPEGARCRKFVFSKDGFEVYSAARTGEPYALLGRSTSATSKVASLQAVLRIKISKQQRVFSQLPPWAEETGYVDGPLALNRQTVVATYKSADGRRSGEVKMVFLPSQILQMDAILNGRFIEIFN